MEAHKDGTRKDPRTRQNLVLMYKSYMGKTLHWKTLALPCKLTKQDEATETQPFRKEVEMSKYYCIGLLVFPHPFLSSHGLHILFSEETAPQQNLEKYCRIGGVSKAG